MAINKTMKSFKQYITELFEKPYTWKSVGKKHSREEILNSDEMTTSYRFKHRYGFKTDDGRKFVVEILHGKDIIDRKNTKVIHKSIASFADESREVTTGVTDKGDAMRIFSTVIAILLDELKEYKPEMMKFFGDKHDFRGDELKKTGRIKLYKSLVNRFAKKAGYNHTVKDYGGDDVTFTLTRKK